MSVTTRRRDCRQHGLSPRGERDITQARLSLRPDIAELAHDPGVPVKVG